MPGWLEPVDGGFRLIVRLTPKSARDGIDGVTTTPDGRAALAARVRAVPEKGKANKALIQLLAKAAGVAPSSVSLISGDTSRVKVLQVVGDPRRLIELAGETAQKNG
ncbi:MAG: DUF167 domain-containing protein [Rhodobiaceae bacterium]|nr:DUF167 domain-containing protein [Rhodobiaceae bacterium]